MSLEPPQVAHLYERSHWVAVMSVHFVSLAPSHVTLASRRPALPFTELVASDVDLLPRKLQSQSHYVPRTRPT